MSTNYKFRIPPSPTGNLHLGTVRTALYNLLLSKKYNGKFVFRLEDTDKERSKSEFTEEILEGFKWLGITWDEGPFRQSENLARHQMVLDVLLREKLAYKCYASKEELDHLREMQVAKKEAPRYDNRHRDLSKEQEQEFIDEGRQPVIRLRLPDNQIIAWDDMVRGTMSVNSNDLGGDFVIAKANGNVLYNFAVVIDDHDSNITHVIRGEDHLSNTGKQIAIYKSLGWAVPTFGHVPLIFTQQKEKLSKRKHGDIASISMYKSKGYLPEAINNYLIGMSWHKLSADGESGKEIFLLDNILEDFELSDISKSAAIYDLKKLDWISKEHFKLLSSQEVLKRAKAFLESANYIDLNKFSQDKLIEIVSLVKDGLTKLSELPEAIKYFFVKEINISELKEDLDKFDSVKEIWSTLRELLNNLKSWDKDSIGNALTELSEKLNIKKGKKLFMPIRIALTGQKGGPDLVTSIFLLEKDIIVERLNKALCS